MVGVEVCLYGGVGHFNVWGLGENKRRPFALEAPLVVETFYLFLGVGHDEDGRPEPVNLKEFSGG